MSYGPIRARLRRGEVLILDGAIGTDILRRDLTWADHQVLSRPTVVRAAVDLSLEARAAGSGGRPVAVAGAITTLEWCFRPDLAPTPDQARPEYLETIGTLAEAGCDLVLIET